MAEAGGTFFLRPNAVERTFSRFFGMLVGRFGLGARHYYLLEVRGRRTGHLYSTPVNLFDYGGGRFLISPRGHTQWVRNAHASRMIALKRGGRSEEFALRPVADQDKAELLREYLRRFRPYVQRCFPVTVAAPLDDFAAIADRYPVFKLVASRGSSGGVAT